MRWSVVVLAFSACVLLGATSMLFALNNDRATDTTIPRSIVNGGAGGLSGAESASAVSGDGCVFLTWSIRLEARIDCFRIFRRRMATGEFSLIAMVSSGKSDYCDTGLSNGIGYYYRLVAVDDSGEEILSSDPIFAVPHEPMRTGLLVVNGVDWITYTEEIRRFYLDSSVTGIYPYLFWDIFPEPQEGWPFPELVLGSGDFPVSLLDVYETIIWIGNNFNGDLDDWVGNQDQIMTFLNTGGEIMLICRNGENFLFQSLRDYAHITQVYPGYNPSFLSAVYPALTDIGRIGSSSLTDYVDVDTTFATVLYRPPDDVSKVVGLWYASPTGGDFVHLACRPYRFSHQDMRANCEIILRQFFGVTGVDGDDHRLPEDIALHQNYPNPFNPVTRIRFGLTTRTHINLKVYNMLGCAVTTLADDAFEAGYHEIIWDSRNNAGEQVASGVYFYHLEAGEKAISRKMVLLK